MKYVRMSFIRGDASDEQHLDCVIAQLIHNPLTRPNSLQLLDPVEWSRHSQMVFPDPVAGKFARVVVGVADNSFQPHRRHTPVLVAREKAVLIGIRRIAAEEMSRSYVVIPKHPLAFRRFEQMQSPLPEDRVMVNQERRFIRCHRPNVGSGQAAELRMDRIRAKTYFPAGGLQQSRLLDGVVTDGVMRRDIVVCNQNFAHYTIRLSRSNRAQTGSRAAWARSIRRPSSRAARRGVLSLDGLRRPTCRGSSPPHAAQAIQPCRWISFWPSRAWLERRARRHIPDSDRLRRLPNGCAVSPCRCAQVLRAPPL